MRVNDDVSILTRLFVPDGSTLSPALAEKILTLGLSPADKERMNELAAKARRIAYPG